MAVSDLETRPDSARQLPRNGRVDRRIQIGAVERQRRDRVNAPGDAGVAEQCPAVQRAAFARRPCVEDETFEKGCRVGYDVAFATSFTTSPMMPVILKSFGV